MPKVLNVGLIVFLLWAAGTAFAFNGHIVTEGPLELRIGDIADVTMLDTPREVQVTVGNKGQSPLEVRLRMADLVDEWVALGQAEASKGNVLNSPIRSRCSTRLA